MAALTDQTRFQLEDMKNLLQLEHEEAHVRNQSLFEDKSTRHLENDGLLIQAVRRRKARARRSGLLVFREDPSRKGHMQDFAGRTGAVVRLLLVDENHAVAGQGVLGRVGEDHVHVITPDALELYSTYPHLAYDDEKTLAFCPNAVDECLQAEGKMARLLNTVLGSEAHNPP